MSFYDLTKDFVLSAKDLFKYRGKRDNTLPSKGGQKDYEPNNLWIQNKALEEFLQERTTVLAEPRVEKLKNLVEGIWDDERGLVNVKKPGKFWAHMGFTDKRRNWLYPEEALFLMESNTLEVYHYGVPLSIQEAYNMFLGSDVSIEEYQVFSHLRRLGFVVLRHENQPVITSYEKQINLDKYMNKKSRKDKTNKLKKDKHLEQGVQPKGMQDLNHSSAKVSKLPLVPNEAVDITIEDISKNDHYVANSDKDVQENKNLLSESCSKTSIMEVDKLGSDSIYDTEQNTEISTHDQDANTTVLESKQRKRPGSPETDTSLESAKRNCLDSAYVASTNSALNIDNLVGAPLSTINENTVETSAQGFYDSSWSSCLFNKGTTQLSESMVDTICPAVVSDSNSSIIKTDSKSHSESKHENSSVQLLQLPNIANTEMVIMKSPSPHLLPENVNFEEQPELLNYDVGKYHIMNPPREMSKKAQREEERDKQIQGLHFSLPEYMQKKPIIAAANWKEYKQKVAERLVKVSETTPVDHLWNGKVTPLLHPGQSWSHQGILSQLSIIKSADNETLLPDSDCVVDVKITYDVHLPDSKFKKSMPGVPNHHVCVSKCSSDLPGLAEIQQVWSRFKDTVPLHWAVVDSGDIAFYVFDSTRSSKVFL